MTLFLIALLFGQATGFSQIQGTVSGRVQNRDGSPAGNVRVMAIDADDARPGADGAALISIAATDSQGRYRLETVPPGRYYIAAGFLELPSYYPGGDKAAARIFTVTAGQTISGIDFTIPAQRVQGRLLRPNSEPVRLDRGNTVRLTAGFGRSLSAPIREDGTFEFLDVRPGTYRLIATAPLTASTAQIVVADRDIADANLVLTLIKAVTGRVVVDGGGPVPRFALDMVEAGGQRVKLMVSTNRLFTLKLIEGEQPLSVAPESLPDGYSVKSLRYGRFDLLKQPANIAMSDSSELVVTLQSPRRRRVEVRGRMVPFDASLPTAVVTLQSAAFVENTSALVRPDGSFRIRDVMPERYTLISNLSVVSQPAFAVGESDIEDLVITLPTPAAADPEKVVGSLSWVIYEAFSGAVVDRGNGPVRIKDITVRETGNGSDIRTQKAVALNSNFSLVMSESVTEWQGTKTSLTLTVRHSNYDTISFESFRMSSPGRAVAFAKNTELGIDVLEVAPRRWEVARTQFIDDVPIDVSHSGMTPRGAPYWRVVILKGSNLTWPSLINGRMAAN